jgi:L-lactate utilization protein LutC
LPTSSPPAEAPKKTRGRPAAGETAGVATPAPAAKVVEEEDPFAVDAPAPVEEKKYELTDVRAALIAYQKKTTPEAARKLLKDIGGADTLVSLDASKFAAVIKATA